MEVNKYEYKIIIRALTTWEQEGRLSTEQAADLKENLLNKDSGRRQVAQYFFFIALCCILLAFGTIFLNEKLLEKIKAYFSWSDLVIALISACLSILWFWYIGAKRKIISAAAYEVYMVLGGLTVLTTLVYLCKEAGMEKSHLPFLSLAFLVLAILSPLLHSKALWIGAIAGMIAWFGSFSEWLSTGNLFLGMNYPVRFTVLGLLILAFAWLQVYFRPMRFLRIITYTAGLLIFFTGLWAVSIFGNFDSLAGWQAVRQIHVLAWSLVFASASVISFYLGIRFKDDLARDAGALFLIINLYTRYFEYFWDTMNKGIFFLVLAITFGFLGWWLERTKRTSGQATKANNK